MQDMQCMLQLSPTDVLVGGHQEKIIQFDLSAAQEVQMVKMGENGCAILRQHPRFICSGDPTGKVALHDPSTLKVEHSLEAHTGSLSDFDVHGNLLVTCGFSCRQGNLSVDRFLMVYDMRMMRVVAPLTVMLDPLLLRFLPSFSSRLACVSSIGQFQLLETAALSEPNLYVYQVDTGGGMCLTFDVSPSCQCLAFGDSGGSVHLYSSSPQSMFNAYSRETEFADSVESVSPINIHDEQVPLSIIPGPLCQPNLLSDWPAQFLQKVYRITPPIDPEILRTMKMVGTIGYAPNPGTFLRNQVTYKLEKKGCAQKLFASDSQHGKSEDTFVSIPKRYRKIEVKYSKMGADDFDFDHYNRTGFTGLEATLPNSYCNAMLQVLYYTEPVSVSLLNHTCRKEFCLSCELSFLFYMLNISQGIPCQASNFLRAFRTIPEASALGLILSDQAEAKKKANLPRLIQSWNRFILQQMHSEFTDRPARKGNGTVTSTVVEGPDPLWNVPAYNYYDPGGKLYGTDPDSSDPVEPKSEELASVASILKEEEEESPMSKLFGMKQKHTNHCVRCSRETSKESIVLLCNLLYPDPSSIRQKYSFAEVLERSLCTEQTTPAWCDKCNKYQPTVQSRRLLSLPNILSINCGLDNEQDKQFWQKQAEVMTVPTEQEHNSKQLLASTPGPKPCRYGTACSRPDCRFGHEGRNTSTANSVVSYGIPLTSWLPHSIRIDLMEDSVVHVKKLKRGTSEVETNPSQNEQVQTDESKGSQAETKIRSSKEYDLAAVVCYIHDRAHPERKNLVAMINVGPNHHQQAMGCSPVSQWYIVNDFSITPIPAEEAVWFNLEWKIPCVLYWYVRNLVKDFLPPVVNPLTVDVFSEDKSLAQNSGMHHITFTPLMAEELALPVKLVAMDAEFVTLNQEEAELRSDGKMSTVKPSHLSVARITCIRGTGPLEGTPFIDDYISTQEQVVDYLTKFSGIKPGDLDANFSSKHLTTLKSTYQKLRFLVDSGVKFVGHGLKNDFRVINLVVPGDQVIDTVILFHKLHHRMVSLRFLAWHFLGLKIQSVTHDSIEDARAALQLYRRYQELEKNGKVEAALNKLYEIGKKLHWKVPEDD